MYVPLMCCYHLLLKGPDQSWIQVIVVVAVVLIIINYHDCVQEHSGQIVEHGVVTYKARDGKGMHLIKF